MNILKLVCIGCFATLTMIIICLLILYLRWYLDLKKNSQIVQKNCEKYKKIACEHQPPTSTSSNIGISNIIGGEYAMEGSLPHMAFLINNATNISFCGGTLISENFIMTAAHCVNTTENLFIKLGSITSLGEDNVGIWVDAVEVIQQPTFKEAQALGDIALIKLTKPVKFTPYIRPICLDTPFDKINDERLTGSGWGFSESGPISKYLRIVDLDIADEELEAECEKRFGILDVQINTCVGFTGEKKISCPGDSGGPLQIELKDGCSYTYRQIGIASHISNFEACEKDFQGKAIVIYTNVKNWVTWIAPQVWPEDY